MRFFESYIGKRKFKYLPAYCIMLQEQYLEPLAKLQYEISREIKLPVLDRLTHLTEAQIIEMGKASLRELLQYLADEKPREHIQIFLKRWKTDQLAMIGKLDLIAEDITLVNYIRSKAIRHFIPQYTRDAETILELISELESFFTGTVTASFNTYIDILQDDISEHEKDLLEAQRIAGMGSFEWDAVSNKTTRSPEADKIFDIAEKSPESFLTHVYEPDRDKVRAAMTGAIKEGTLNCEFRFQGKHSLKYVWAKGVPITKDGKLLKFIGTAQDITERKRNEQDLLEKTIALERSNESLQQFAFVASHDLQEPIRQISTFADIVLTQEACISESSRASLQKVVRYAIRMRRMIDDILHYSTLAHWEGREDLNLKELLQMALENLEQKIAEKKAVVEFDELPTIHAVPSQVQQLFQNLISNALKFTRPGTVPTVNITHEWLDNEHNNLEHLSAADKYLKLEVQDNGIGFEQQFAGKIFGLFSRLNNKKDYQGSGIGLAIAKKIVNNHGGVISASSVKGVGTRFTILLPQ